MIRNPSKLSFPNIENEDVIMHIKAGMFHSIAATESGRVFTWGYNAQGQLGDNTVLRKNSPTEITNNFTLGLDEKISCVVAGALHTLASTNVGHIFSWGYNGLGQLGDNSLIDKHTPTKLGLFFTEGIGYLAAGEYHSAVVSSTGSVYTWGYNESGQLGNNSTTDKLIPTNITSRLQLGIEERVSSIDFGNEHSILTTSSGRLFLWGENGDGQIGTNSSIDQLAPYEVSSTFSKSDSIIETRTYFYEETVELTFEEREGYTFNGWYTDVLLTNIWEPSSSMPPNDVTLYAFYSKNFYQ